MGGSCKLVVKLAVVPNDDGRKQGVEVCIRSNGANKGASSSLPRSFDVASTKAPKNRTPWFHIPSKLSSSILTTMLSAGIAALAHRTKEIACQDAKQIAQQIVTYGPQNGSKIGPSKWVPCNQLINLSCIFKLGMAPKTGSEKRHRNEGLTEQKRKRNI